MITVEEFRKGQTKEAQEQFKRFEKNIDAQLLRSGAAQIHLDTSEKPGAAVVNLIKSVYEQAGWVVKRESGSDCRGDSWDYLYISEPIKTRSNDVR
jgi:hypothetical protein